MEKGSKKLRLKKKKITVLNTQRSITEKLLQTAKSLSKSLAMMARFSACMRAARRKLFLIMA